MKTSFRPSLMIALAMAGLMAAAAPARAQDYKPIPPEHYEETAANEDARSGAENSDPQQRRRINSEYRSMREKREAASARQRGDRGKAKTESPEALYPLATREEPDVRASRNGLKELQKLQEAFGAEDYQTVLSIAGKVLDDPGSNAYEKAFASLLAGNAASATGDDAAALVHFKNALAANGLDNNNHYAVMFNLAVVEYDQGQYQAALDTLDRFEAETKAEKPEGDVLRGAALMSLERYADAAAVYEARLEKDPTDKTALMNAASAYQQLGQDDKAVALLARAQTSGMLTTPNEYRALYVTYINSDRDDEALKVIEDGLAKGIIQPDPQLARDYMVLAQKAYYGGDDARAIELYKRAVPIAADGEAALNLAKVYHEAGRKAEAAAAAQQALDKGVKAPDEARKLLGGG